MRTRSGWTLYRPIRFPRRALVLFSLGLVLLAIYPAELQAIHFVINSSERIEREHGRLKLGMALSDFVKAIKSKEASGEIGQFEEERRFHADPASFGPNVSDVLADFYKEQLFRIEVNYPPVGLDSSAVEEVKGRLTGHYGTPRMNSLPGADLFFWDDGKTRLILERDLAERSMAYSITYIDDDLFHQASHERVGKETGGKSTYGR